MFDNHNAPATSDEGVVGCSVITIIILAVAFLVFAYHMLIDHPPL